MPRTGIHAARRVVAAAASCAAAAAQDDLDARVARALATTRPVLLKQLGRAQHDHLGIVCQAALHDAVPLEHPVLRKALAKLLRQSLSGTYQLAVRLMVLADLPPSFAGRLERAQEDTELLRRGYVSGGFAYSAPVSTGITRGSSFDMSNTQYGALGLRAPVALGVAVPDSVWERLLSDVLGHQAEDGGFDYREGTTTPYASMTVAGITCLEICLQHLPRAHARAAAARAAIDRAWAWMDGHRSDVGDPKAHACYYFHFGLERAGVLSDRGHVGGDDWYRRGAEMMLRTHLRRGGWAGRLGYTGGARTSRPDGVTTAFAVLFLRRRFTRDPGVPITPSGASGIGELGEQATDARIRAAAERAVALGIPAVPDLLEAMRSEVLARRKSAALALPRIAGRDFGYHPYRDPAGSRDAIRAAEHWWRTRPRPR